jgi:hypothetical protein
MVFGDSCAVAEYNHYAHIFTHSPSAEEPQSKNGRKKSQRSQRVSSRYTMARGRRLGGPGILSSFTTVSEESRDRTMVGQNHKPESKAGTCPREISRLAKAGASARCYAVWLEFGRLRRPTKLRALAVVVLLPAVIAPLPLVTVAILLLAIIVVLLRRYHREKNRDEDDAADDQ